MVGGNRDISSVTGVLFETVGSKCNITFLISTYGVEGSMKILRVLPSLLSSHCTPARCDGHGNNAMTLPRRLFDTCTAIV